MPSVSENIKQCQKCEKYSLERVIYTDYGQKYVICYLRVGVRNKAQILLHVGEKVRTQMTLLWALRIVMEGLTVIDAFGEMY